MDFVAFKIEYLFYYVVYYRGHAQTTWTVRGRGVGQMSTFVYVGGRGGWDHVYVVFFPYNFTRLFLKEKETFTMAAHCKEQFLCYSRYEKFDKIPNNRIDNRNNFY